MKTEQKINPDPDLLPQSQVAAVTGGSNAKSYVEIYEDQSTNRKSNGTLGKNWTGRIATYGPTQRILGRPRWDGGRFVWVFRFEDKSLVTKTTKASVIIIDTCHRPCSNKIAAEASKSNNLYSYKQKREKNLFPRRFTNRMASSCIG